ncbi:MAG: GPW/gp25 family protein [Chloroflexi bacterium]|nr:GPW/gp25 family protein [Chloroflexota bacterium]MCI0580783.1 GPW/gp25 family protein [Chloroflexota bacterium]MCI0648694.1 GPW/gp25 family protein [Chloroflexota bacterium]MCI0731509.1 GPW/gp25 family protein [Chloroflexota bacterium]
MNNLLYRAWLFVHPDLEASGPWGESRAFVGLGLSERATIAMVEGEGAVRQSILLLLSTAPGERVMRPQYGCYIHRLIFSPNDDTTAGLAIHYVKRAIQRWEPRVDILRVDAGRDPEAPELLNIFLEYRVRATQRTETLAFSFDLIGEGA